MEDLPKEETLATPGVLDKYQTAGRIANAVLERVIAKCVAGANIAELCEFGDNEVDAEVAKVYAKKKLEKGIAFPTCISVNEICGHFSPLRSEPSLLKDGDLVKIDLGVHIDGFIALAAHTIVISSQPVDGRKADVVLAAYNALQGALRTIKTGNTNYDVTDVIAQVAESYKCQPVEGVLSHELKKHLIDGNTTIINKATFDQKVEEHEFGLNEVFALDIFVSTGEGKTKETEFRTTVFKRAIERTYTLKLKASRAFFAEAVDKYPTMNFTLRAFKDETATKLDMAIGKNKKLGKKKGAKKKVQDPFLRKEWYDVKAPAPFTKRYIGKTCVTRTTGTRIATDYLKGRVVETSFAELSDNQDSWRKIKLSIEDIQGRACMTNFHAMDMTRDRLCQFIRKWQTLIDANCEAKTNDGYVLRVFVTAFTGRQQNQARKTSYAQHQQIKVIRKKIVDIITAEAAKSALPDFVAKLNHVDAFSKQITKACQFVYPLSAVVIRKVKTLKKPKFDIVRLNELYKEQPVKVDARRGKGKGAEGAEPAAENLLQ